MSYAKLHNWIAENKPELDAEFLGLHRDEIRGRLNEITGLNVPGCITVESGSEMFLARLIEMEKA